MQGNKCLLGVSGNDCFSKKCGSLQSAQSRDWVVTYLVYTRTPTNKVAATRDIVAHNTIHFSKEYGSTKLGISPAGGRMLGIFASVFASAILPGARNCSSKHGIDSRSEQCQRRDSLSSRTSRIYVIAQLRRESGIFTYLESIMLSHLEQRNWEGTAQMCA